MQNKTYLCKERMTGGKRNIIRHLLEEYDIRTAEDIRDVLKDLTGGLVLQRRIFREVIRFFLQYAWKTW